MNQLLSNDLGNILVVSAWWFGLFGVVLGIIAALRKSESLSEVVRYSMFALGAATVFSTAILGYRFIISDFTNQYIWQFSNRDMPSIYKFTAIWGGMDGSMLLWACFLAISSVLASIKLSGLSVTFRSWLLTVIHSSNLFFLTIVVYLTNPFRHIAAPFIPPDGNGLNPLLQNPYMAIHPPTLYIGFVTLSIPFAFCMAALLSRELSDEWTRLTRKWTLVAWGVLTLGITLGGYWAYIELGWGGFWAWDPVENASFMPWLTATAFLHSVMVQERKGMLKSWNVWLIVLSYGLTVFGTFLTRSGIVQSVHAFASTDIGWVFLLYLALIFALTTWLTVSRRTELRSARTIESFLSRETVFLLNNLIFLAIFFAVIWGVMFPVLSEAVTGTKQAVSIPYFNAVTIPMFLALIFLMGIGPTIPWRQANLSQLKRAFLMPLAIAFIAAVALVWAGVEGVYPPLAYALCLFVFLTILGELYRIARIRRAMLQGDLSENATGSSGSSTVTNAKHINRVGGLVVHLGVLIATIGITASMAHKVEREFALDIGERYEIGRFAIELEAINERRQANFDSLYSQLGIFDRASGDRVATLKPELRFYRRNSETTTEVAIKKSLREDLYLVLAGLDEQGIRGTFKVYLNPLQAWLWIGVGIMMIGTLIVLYTPRNNKR